RAVESVTMIVEDDGPQFDPLSLPPPDVTASLADRRGGGLCVFLVRDMMDTVTYARIAGRNQLRMSKRLCPRTSRPPGAGPRARLTSPPGYRRAAGGKFA